MTDLQRLQDMLRKWQAQEQIWLDTLRELAAMVPSEEQPYAQYLIEMATTKLLEVDCCVTSFLCLRRSWRGCSANGD